MNDYYNLLRPLTAPVIDYINDPSEGIQHVLVTAHRAMAQQFHER